MPTKRKLSDLYQRGVELVLDDGDGGITVWLQKLTSVDQQVAIRKANARRSQIVAESRDETSELFLSSSGEVENLDRDQLLDAVAAHDVTKRSQAIEAEVEADEAWTKEDYLQGLYDAWNDGLRERYAEDPDDEDAKRVFEAMQEYVDAVNTQLELELKRSRRELDETRSDAQLRKSAVENGILARVDFQWLDEYRRCQIFFATREPDDHRKRYFADRAEIDELATETFVQLSAAYSALEVDVVEGKGSEETPVSSSSSEPQQAEATEASSGQKIAAA